MKREYRWSTAAETDPQQTAQLSKEINVSETIAKILIRRGITTYDKAKEFFRPEIANLHDPFLMEGMEQAVVRIFQAVDRNERIIIFGEGLRNESIIRRVIDGRIQDAVELDEPAGFIQFVLHAGAEGDFNHALKLLRQPVAGSHVVPGMDHALALRLGWVT